jgi:hypothetical protein
MTTDVGDAEIASALGGEYLDDGALIAALFNLAILQSTWIRAKVNKTKFDEKEFANDLESLTMVIAKNVAAREGTLPLLTGQQPQE